VIPPVEAVLLDAGGVLLDLDYAYLRRLTEALRCPATEEQLSRAEALARREVDRAVRAGGRVGEAWRDYFHVILGHAGLPAQEHGAVIDTLWDAHRRVGLWTVATAGGPGVVAELKRRGLRLGVVSNAEGLVARDLDRAGYRGMFETVVDSHLVGVEKPDPAIFAIALARMNLSPASAVFVGDVPAVDVVGARAAGLTPLLLDRHDLYPETAPRLRALDELPAWLDAAAAEPGGTEH
jgi:putative hydrolase of the HAD superfamily